VGEGVSAWPIEPRIGVRNGSANSFVRGLICARAVGSVLVVVGLF